MKNASTSFSSERFKSLDTLKLNSRLINVETLLLKHSLVSSIENIFYLTERDKGDYHNLHDHMLLETNINMTYKEVKYGNVSVGNYQPI